MSFFFPFLRSFMSSRFFWTIVIFSDTVLVRLGCFCSLFFLEIRSNIFISVYIITIIASYSLFLKFYM